VNKCLIALVNRKVVQKESSTVCDEIFSKQALVLIVTFLGHRSLPLEGNGMIFALERPVM